MKKWKILFAISSILAIIFMVLCGVFNTDNTMVIWQIMKILFSVSLVVTIISFIGFTVVSIKNKGKMPIWLITIIVTILVIVVLGVTAKIMDSRTYQKYSCTNDFFLSLIQPKEERI